jgi:hypothetical protein
LHIPTSGPVLRGLRLGRRLLATGRRLGRRLRCAFIVAVLALGRESCFPAGGLRAARRVRGGRGGGARRSGARAARARRAQRLATPTPRCPSRVLPRAGTAAQPACVPPCEARALPFRRAPGSQRAGRPAPSRAPPAVARAPRRHTRSHARHGGKAGAHPPRRPRVAPRSPPGTPGTVLPARPPVRTCGTLSLSSSLSLDDMAPPYSRRSQLGGSRKKLEKNNFLLPHEP